MVRNQKLMNFPAVGTVIVTMLLQCYFDVTVSGHNYVLVKRLCFAVLIYFFYSW